MRQFNQDVGEAIDTGAKAASNVSGSLAKVVENFLASLFDTLFPPPPPTRDQAERMARSAEEKATDRAWQEDAARQQAEHNIFCARSNGRGSLPTRPRPGRLITGTPSRAHRSSGIEDRSETTGWTEPAPPCPPGAGRDRQTISGAIKTLFKDAVKALTRGKDEDAPEPKPRRRRGETEGELRKHVPPADHGSDQPAARGRYAGLQPAKAEKIADAAVEAFGPPDPCNPFEPMWQQPYTEDHTGFGEDFGDAIPPPACPSPNP